MDSIREFLSQVNEFLRQPLIEVGESRITLGLILFAVVLLVVGNGFIRWSSRLLRRKMADRHVDPDLIQAVVRAYLILALVLLLFSALSLLRVPLGAFAFVSGAIAIGVGFGAQNIINNFISGWILMWERPIRIGDFLEIGDVNGKVEAINTRSTRIRRIDGVHLLIPNSHLLENTVTNWTHQDNTVRTTVRVGVAYGSPVERVTELLLQAAEEHPEVLKDPPYEVVFEDFGDSSLVFDLHFWLSMKGMRTLRVARSDLRYAIDASFRENGITISFPQRDVHLDGEISIRRRGK